MKRATKSPIRVGKCFPWPFKGRKPHEPRKVCRWVCVAAPRAAEFVHRRDPTRTAVLHPSTKRVGWQVSKFDTDGAVGDVIRSDCSEALHDAGIEPMTWRLRTVR